MVPVQKFLDRVLQSLWFIPAIWVIASAAAAFGMVALDHATDIESRAPLIFGGGPEGARGLLSSIASSMITVVGVVFSITIVALQLTSSQYSPRVLRNFMGDRTSQVTLGSFIGAFVYSLLVLRTVRADGDERQAFVPVLAVTGAVLLAVFAVAMLVYFIHHIASRMQVSSITASVTQETLQEIDRQTRSRSERPNGKAPGLPAERGRLVEAEQSGYLQYVETDGLVKLAERDELVIRVAVAPGAWVQRHAALFEMWGTPTDGIDSKLRALVSVGDERIVFQDPEFGLQQLVDIADKALSPGINDPTTARNAINRIVEILVAAGRSELTPVEHFADDGRLRVSIPRRDFADLVRTGFEEIAHFGGRIPTIRRSIERALDTIAGAVDADRRRDVLAFRRSMEGRSSGTPDRPS